MNGYMGKLLVVDSPRGAEGRAGGRGHAHDFVGGAGYAARYLYDDIKPGIDPMGPANTLMFMTGPLVGTCPFLRAARSLCTLSADRHLGRIQLGWLLGRRAQVLRL